MRLRGFKIGGLMALLCLALCSCAPNPPDVVVIGSKMDTEGAILGYIQLVALQRAGLKVEDRIETGPTLIVRQALLAGEIDGYLEYTGTALVNFMGLQDRTVLTDPALGYRTIQRWDARHHQIVWLHPWSGINNTYTLLMKAEAARRLGLASISDLAAYLAGGRSFRLAADHEFAARPDGLAGLLHSYGLDSLPNLEIVQMDPGLVYQALDQGSVEAAIGYSTDGRIAALHLIRLRDDRHYFPVYNPTPTYRKAVLDRFPQIASILNKIAGRITADEITTMNYRHDVRLERARKLAEEWLNAHGF
ncbi:MAG: glycine/betaine ABC transporter substrate-binding protein [Calditrichaeota bacterium]|nr:MAG: glycine/betaine ABC transporter substrate-binding protein [Calditrichota bacterium]